MSVVNQLLVPYKALGVVCSPVTACLRAKGGGVSGDSVLLAVCGAVLHQYNARTLRLTSVSDCMLEPITHVACTNHHTVIAYGKHCALLANNRKIAQHLSGVHESAIVSVVCLGVSQCVSVDEQSLLVVWQLNDGSVYAQMQLPHEHFSVSVMCQPATYVNKVLIGSQQGGLQLVNVKTCAVLHEFTGWSVAVRCLQQSPIPDVFGVGLQDGMCVLHNVVYDQSIFSVTQGWGPVTSIAFRSDSGVPCMVTASTQASHIAVWHLEDRRLLGELRAAHTNGVHTLVTVPNQSLMLSTGADNAIRTWIFDQTDSLARQLAIREGASEPASFVRFHGTDGEMVMMSSADGSLRAYSTWKDTKQANLGTAASVRRSVAKKKKLDFDALRLPAINKFSASCGREAEWANVCTVHYKTAAVPTWFTHTANIGAHQLVHPRFESTVSLRHACATDVCVSVCGDWAVVGYSTGHLDIYNMQSCKHKGTYIDPVLASERAHCSSVSALCIDGLSALLISADTEGTLNMWHLRTRAIRKQVQLGVGVSHMCLHEHNNLLALYTVDHQLLLADVHLGRVVRRIPAAHSDVLYDMQFTQDGACLYTCAADNTLKTWQLHTKALVNVMAFEHAAVSVALSPTGELIATCHVGQRGVYLWANRAVHDRTVVLRALPEGYIPPLYALPNAAAYIHMTHVQANDTDKMSDADTDGENKDTTNGLMDKVPDKKQLGQLVTLSGQATTRWVNLLDLDVIQRRNKPKEPPKKPKSAPFFLPTTSSLEGLSFDTESKEGESSASRIVETKRSLAEPLSPFAVQLLECNSVDTRTLCFAAMTNMAPSQLHLQLSHITVIDENGSPSASLMCLLQVFKQSLQSNTQFELAHAYLGTALKLYRADLCRLSAHAEVQALLRDILHLVEQGWHSLDTHICYDMTVLQWLTSALL